MREQQPPSASIDERMVNILVVDYVIYRRDIGKGQRVCQTRMVKRNISLVKINLIEFYFITYKKGSNNKIKSIRLM
jgi:hypothetical protein